MSGIKRFRTRYWKIINVGAVSRRLFSDNGMLHACFVPYTPSQTITFQSRVTVLQFPFCVIIIVIISSPQVQYIGSGSLGGVKTFSSHLCSSFLTTDGFWDRCRIRRDPETGTKRLLKINERIKAHALGLQA